MDYDNDGTDDSWDTSCSWYSNCLCDSVHVSVYKEQGITMRTAIIVITCIGDDEHWYDI